MSNSTYRYMQPTPSQPPNDASTGLAIPRWLWLIQAIIAYEWLVSGVNKLLDPTFATQLPGMLHDSMKDNPYTWYVSFIRGTVIPNPMQYAHMVAWGETLVGAALLGGAVLWVMRPQWSLTRLAAILGCLALIAAAFMNVNYYLMGGGALPWIDPANALDEGIRLDALLPLVCLALLGANVSAMRRTRTAVQQRPQVDAVVPLLRRVA